MGFQLGDFGLALPLPAEVRNLNQWANWDAGTRQHWIHDTEWRATTGYTPPVSRNTSSTHIPIHNAF
jgi:hypothetical protein